MTGNPHETPTGSQGDTFRDIWVAVLDGSMRKVVFSSRGWIVLRIGDMASTAQPANRTGRPMDYLFQRV